MTVEERELTHLLKLIIEQEAESDGRFRIWNFIPRNNPEYRTRLRNTEIEYTADMTTGNATLRLYKKGTEEKHVLSNEEWESIRWSKGNCNEDDPRRQR